MNEGAGKVRFRWQLVVSLFCALFPAFVILLFLCDFEIVPDDLLRFVLVFLWPVVAFCGVLRAHRARSAARQAGGRLHVRGIAMTAMVIAYASLGLALAAHAVWWSGGAILRSGESNESGAVASLRAIASAETEYWTSKSRYSAISDLVGARLLDSRFSNKGVVSGYRFEIHFAGSGYQATATSLSRKHGMYNYYISEDGIIHWSVDASCASPERPDKSWGDPGKTYTESDRYAARHSKDLGGRAL